jgi:hypothetical protein
LGFFIEHIYPKRDFVRSVSSAVRVCYVNEFHFSFQGNRWRRRCISESVDTAVDSEPLDFKTLKPIPEMPRGKQKADELLSSAHGASLDQQMPVQASAFSSQSPQGHTNQTFENAVRNALVELEANEIAMAKSISENENETLENPQIIM